MKIFKKLFDHEYKELSRFMKIADKIEELDPEMQKLSDLELKEMTNTLKTRITNGEDIEDILVEAFATAREAAFRVIKEKPFYVQLLGGLAIHYGNISEMKTGEGKTLTSVLPAYANALTNKGVHIVTVNEYLAERDSKWMGEIYTFLGLSVGVNLRTMSPSEKQQAYNCDILYSTNNEIGFDYLRDNMVDNIVNRVQRPLNFAIIDEVDSVLIDEARTPLIISGGVFEGSNFYMDADHFVKKLTLNQDYIYDEKTKSVNLTDEGTKKAETHFHLTNLYDIENNTQVHFINQALRANFSMKKDIDYVVQEGEIVIVDQFTGRLMIGRAFSDGLHQAIEAKENVKIQDETKTLATITFQNLFRMYKKLAGMTGTAKTEEEEFRNIYNMFVICIPTNKDIIRIDEPDLVYSTKRGKYAAIIDEIEARHKSKQPVLVGTIAIETSEIISELLNNRKIPHEILNAKNHAREAEIIAKAGEAGSVTIATNMAGRGTDIKLPEEVKKLGGLCVIGTERHESRRIDNQLRGRSGRQGDPGFSQFYVSMEDELMVRFGSDRIKDMMQNFGFPETQAIKSKVFTNSISTAQSRVEGNNFDTRKQLLQYDDIMNNHREIMYGKRNQILENDSVRENVLNIFKNHIMDIVNSHTSVDNLITSEDLNNIVIMVNENLFKKDITADILKNLKADDIIDKLTDILVEEYQEKLQNLPSEAVNEFEKSVCIMVIDQHWMEHINTMSHLREGIHLRSYAQEDPLRAYTTEGYNLFDDMLQRIDKDITMFLIKAEITMQQKVEHTKKKLLTNDTKDGAKEKPITVDKIGRNDKCPCGSGKKYKQCCGK